MRFRDRHDAGRRLVDQLAADAAVRDLPDPLVLALPRGGVPVGFEVARGIGAPLDVLVARKLGAPGQPELGIGAVAEGGVRVLDEATVALLGVGADELARVTEREQAELDRRVAHYRIGRPLPPVDGRGVVLVDDGLATGVTARAAIASLQKAATVVLAVPAAAADTAARLRADGVAVVAVIETDDFRAVGR